MVGTALLAFLVANANEPPRRVLVLDFRAENVKPEVPRLLRDAVASHLSTKPGFDVVSTEELRQLVDVEAQRQALGGCTDDSCLAEIANALGAEIVFSGSVGTLGSLTLVNLSLFDAKVGRSLGRATIEAQSLEELPSLIRTRIDAMLGTEAPPAASESTSPWLWVGGGTLAVGVTAGLAAGGGALWANSIVEDGKGPPSGPTGEERLAARGLGQLFVAGAVAGTAVALVGAGLLSLALVE